MTSANVKSRYGYHPRHKFPNDLRLMLTGGAFQRIRPLEGIWSGNLHSNLSFACDPMIETRQSPERSESRTPIKTTHPHFSSIEFLQYGPLTNFSLASNACPGSTLATSKSRLDPFRRLPLADRLRRRNQAPSPAHGGPVIFIGGSTKEAYLIVLTMSTAVGP
jgi:hypothetical protein